jgi:hypothetical protein
MDFNIFPIFPEGTLPKGALGKWVLFVAFLALFNTFQNMITISLTQSLYNAKPEEGT